jgi:hypothetical protein
MGPLVNLLNTITQAVDGLVEMTGLINHRTGHIIGHAAETIIQDDFTLRQPPFGELHISFNNNNVIFTHGASQVVVPLIPLIPPAPAPFIGILGMGGAGG